MTPLRLVCADLHAPPLFSLMRADGTREGYEPAVAQLIADQLGRPLEWVPRPWAEMIPTVQAGDADGLLCGQGISPERLALVDFTRPYAVFDESVLVRAGDPARRAGDLGGRRVAAIAGSVNLTLARSFVDAEVVAFGGESDDVFGEMIGALEAGDVDAVVDDDVALVPLADDPRFEIAFTVRTRNAWGVAVAKDRPDRLALLDDALAHVVESGGLEVAWKQWLPTLEFPFGGDT
ncbi:substrate-binding periplasmic protein [Solicola gregarius]|uniref:ABC transporter substrate-binding protein n=1 Tax=Solicola gregarius TaxID=2908642 RepID=A0AA46TGW2_9ACTN|nr:ABC transporter substrate-binding protein [Solicola gregarius]UYM04910.1 ABC transporter substrate-binding protein [Solicola gregarius]